MKRNVSQSNCIRPQNEIVSTSKERTEQCHESTMRQLSEFQCIMNNQLDDGNTADPRSSNQIDEPIGSNCLGHSSSHSMQAGKSSQSLESSDHHHHNFNQCHHHFPVQVSSSLSQQIEDSVSQIIFPFVLFGVT